MPRLRKAERLRRERISRGLRAYYRAQRRAEQLRRERISASLLAYYEEQRRLRGVRAEGARRYWRRVKQAAGRHDLTLRQARRTIRLADQREIPVTEAALRVKLVPRIEPIPVELPPPPAPPRIEYVPEFAEGEFAFNLRDVNELGNLQIPERFRGLTVEADITFTDRGRFQQRRTIEFYGGENEEAFWSNYYAAIREDYDEVIDETDMDSSDIGIEVMGMRAA